MKRKITLFTAVAAPLALAVSTPEVFNV